MAWTHGRSLPGCAALWWKVVPVAVLCQCRASMTTSNESLVWNSVVSRLSYEARIQYEPWANRPNNLIQCNLITFSRPYPKHCGVASSYPWHRDRSVRRVSDKSYSYHSTTFGLSEIRSFSKSGIKNITASYSSNALFPSSLSLS